jgi:hypothetical protein
LSSLCVATYARIPIFYYFLYQSTAFRLRAKRTSRDSGTACGFFARATHYARENASAIWPPGNLSLVVCVL